MPRSKGKLAAPTPSSVAPRLESACANRNEAPRRASQAAAGRAPKNPPPPPLLPDLPLQGTPPTTAALPIRPLLQPQPQKQIPLRKPRQSRPAAVRRQRDVHARAQPEIQ